MAQLKNINKIFDLRAGGSITVGNNRTITRENRATFTGCLHGHPVFKIVCDMSGESGDCRVTLNTCGYMTVTMRSAMNDFCSAFGVSVGVSFAKGVFSARYNGKDITHNGYGIIVIQAQRYAGESK